MDDPIRAMPDQRGVGDEKPRIEALGPARRGDGSGDEVEAVERRKDAGGGKARPGALRGGGRRAVIGHAEREPRLLKGLADGGEGERTRESGRGAARASNELFLDNGL